MCYGPPLSEIRILAGIPPLLTKLILAAVTTMHCCGGRERAGTAERVAPLASFPARLSREHSLSLAKPWKCRLRLHDWDDRENPETHEHYEVCLRCNAYRERVHRAAQVRVQQALAGVL